MSAPTPIAATEHDPVLAAFESAPVDQSALTPEQAAELEVRMATGASRGRGSDEVLAAIEARSKPEE
ncbi:MAG: hypothetical protein KF819_31395 [Labilithrix sp.]|nr:hypothetical protein [Labilithrix sp.]